MRAKPGRRQKPARLYFRKPRHGRGGQYVILDTVDGRRVEIGTGAPEGDRATAEKRYQEYIGEKHKPEFGAGHPSEVLVADVLVFYAEHPELRGAGGGSLPNSLVHLGEFWGGMRVSQITPERCKQYEPWRINKGDTRTRNKPHRALKPATARKDLLLLDAALRLAVKNHKLMHAPPIAKPAPSNPRVRFLTKPEAARLLAAALGWQFEFRDGRWVAARRIRARINRPLARLILIGLYTGTRKDRILRLMLIQNLQGGWIDVERGILHRKAKNEPETKKRAPSVPLGDRLIAHARRWQKPGRRYVIERNGRPIRAIINGWERIARDAGLNYDGQEPADRVTPHTLRHTCVSWLLAEGLSCKQVGDYVGMTEQLVQRVYGHPDTDVQRATANAIGRRRRAHETPTKYPARA